MRQKVHNQIDKTQRSKIEVGSYVVYGHALGRCAGLKFGKIIKIDELEGAYRYFVVGVDDDWDFETPKLSKRGILQFENRIIVLPFEMLPEYAQKLLNDVQAE